MKKLLTKKSELLEALLTFRKIFVSVGVFSFFINLLMLAPSIYMLQVYDRVLSARNDMTLLMLTLLVLGLYVLMSGLEFVRSMVLVRLSAKLDMLLNKRVFTAMFEANLRNPGTGASQSLSDLTNVRQFLTGNGLFAFFDAPWMPIYLVVIFLFHPWLGLIALLGALSLFGLAYLNERSTRMLLSGASGEASASNSIASNNLRNAEVIEAMGMLPAITRRWFGRQEKFLAMQGEASRRAGTIGAVTRFVRISLQSLILGAGALLVIDGYATGGIMIASSVLLGRCLGPVELAIGSWKQLISARTSYERLESLLEQYPQRESGMSLPKPVGRINVEGLFAGPPGVQISTIKNVNFALEPGNVLVVIGPSASGKSTLARLLVGVWHPQAGKVRLDGADISRWNKDELGPHIGYLPQDIELFEGTIAENIARFGELDSNQVIAAAKMAGVHEMILRFPMGYDTPIGVGGNILSGGQKQRIGLARALYGDPTLVVLDEPNSNLDDVGEAALVSAVVALKGAGKTVVLITHRTSIIGVADKLLLLVDGAAQMFGPRDAVLAQMQSKSGRPVASLAGRGTASGAGASTENGSNA
ncbi:MAG: type I secretion system permease/ATPase [Rhodocyclaceae bacterium]|jgi:ATP-binding cassette subfamily C exporter for protease/lipase|nr:type I secretion system permease/ATPase [Rhodocyclaceae bacterium]